MDNLRHQSGTTQALKLFAYNLRRMAEHQLLPEYGLKIRREGRASASLSTRT
jgi:hypothetical protein